MKSKNIFFATCVSMVCISKILPMLVTTKQISRSIFYSSKLYKSSNIPVGTSWVMLDDKDMNVKSKRDMQEIHDDIKKMGLMKCANSNTKLNIIDCCESDICCSKAFLLARMKNIQSQQKSCAIKDKFLRSIAKKGQLLYLQDIQNTYQQLMKYRVILNVCDDADQQKCEEIYATIRDINVCLFAQARVIIEDNFDDWQQSGFKMTPVVESMRAIRDAMNELCKNERLYRDGIKDQKFYLLYKSSLADYSII